MRPRAALWGSITSSRYNRKHTDISLRKVMASSLSYVEEFKKILQSRKYDEYTEEDFHRMISKFSNSELDDVAKAACTYVRGKALDVILSTVISNKVKEDPATELLIRAIQQGCTHEGPILKILLRHKADVNKTVEMQIGGRVMTLSALEAATKQDNVELKIWLQVSLGIPNVV